MSDEAWNDSTGRTAELLARLSWTRRLAAGLVGDDHADDVAQEAWLAAVRRADAAWPPTEGWLAGTVRRLSARAWRSTSRRRDREAGVAAEREDDFSTDDLLERHEALRRLSDRVLELDEPYRSTVLLRFQEDLSPAEIARRQGAPADTVRRRLREGLRRLRDALERDDGHEWRASLLPLVPAAHAFLRHAKPASALPAPTLAPYGGLILSSKLAATLTVTASLIVTLALWRIDAPEPPATTEEVARSSALDAPDAIDAADRDDSSAPPAVADAVPVDERESATAAAAPPADADACVIVGRVLGPEDLPLADVHVRFHDRESLPDTYTDAEGAFRLPLTDFPTDLVWLYVEPDPFHSMHIVRFGSTQRPGYLPPLAAGTVDVGTIRLQSAGVIEGTVSDEHGVPLTKPWMLAGTRDGYAYPHAGGREFGDEHGRYRLEHIRADKWSIEAQHYGHRSQERPVDVVAGRTSRVDLELEDSSTISGTVLDDRDQPLAGVKVSGGFGYYYDWGRETDAVGAFTIPLAIDEPAKLEFEREGWEVVDAPELPVAPGTEDVLVHMTQLPGLRIRVVDVKTREPIEHFGLEVNPHGGPEGDWERARRVSRWPSATHRPGGIAEAYARPGVDSVRVAAPGRMPREVDVELDEGSLDEMTIALSSGARLHGRLTWKGVAVENAEVLLVQMGYHAFQEVTVNGVTIEQDLSPDKATLTLAGGYALGRVIALDPAPLYGFSRFMASKEVRTKTDADGRFRFEGIETSGAYRLEALPPDTIGGASPLLLDDFDLAVDSQNVHDLGDLALPPRTTLSGHIELRAPGPLAGHVVSAGGIEALETLTDEDGAFRFEALAPGEHLISFRGSDELVAESVPYFVRLTEGEDRDVVLPVENSPTCRVRARLTRDGAPFVGAYVLFTSTESSTTQSRAKRLRTLTDEDGVSEDIAPELGSCRVQLGYEDVAIPLVEPRVRLAGAEVDVAIDVALGTLAIAPPEGRSWPSDGGMTFEVRPNGDARFASRRRLLFTDKGVFLPDGTAASDDAGRVLAPLVLAGDGIVHLTVEADPDSDAASWAAEAPYTAIANETVEVRM